MFEHSRSIKRFNSITNKRTQCLFVNFWHFDLSLSLSLFFHIYKHKPWTLIIYRICLNWSSHRLIETVNISFWSHYFPLNLNCFICHHRSRFKWLNKQRKKIPPIRTSYANPVIETVGNNKIWIIFINQFSNFHSWTLRVLRLSIFNVKISNKIVNCLAWICTWLIWTWPKTAPNLS